MVGPQKDEEGRFRSSISDEELLSVIEEMEIAGTGDIEAEAGFSRQNADRRLKKLEEKGKVESVKIGGSLAWSVVESSDG